MFQLDTSNPRIIYRRPAGQLTRPSDRMISGHGLGELDGVLDVLKNFGSGIVKYVSLGTYDPSKNRFYVPFSSGQMRNWAQGATNTVTLGLVKTDKFFGSQTMRTVGTIAGGIAAAGAAYAGGQFLSAKFGGTGSISGSSGTSAPTTEAGSFFSSVKSMLPSLSTVSKIVDVGAKVIGGFGGGQSSQPTGQQMIAVPVPVDQGMGPPMLFPQPGVIYPTTPGGMYPTGMVSYGSGASYSPMGGGGGGGFGPPGSEFASMDPSQQIQDGSEQIGDQGIGTGTKVVLAVAGGAIVYYLFLRK